MARSMNAAPPSAATPTSSLEDMPEDLAWEDDFVGEPHMSSHDQSPQCLDPTDAELVPNISGKVLFDPHYTKHSRSSEWTPPELLARYLQLWLFSSCSVNTVCKDKFTHVRFTACFEPRSNRG